MLETKRLIFRKITLDDLPWLIEMRSPDAVNRYLGGIEMQNPEALAKRIAFYIDCHERYGFGFCVTILKETGEQIGACGLQPLADTGEIEVGYSFAEEFWGRGFGYEAAMGWLKYGFETAGLTRIVAVTHPDNTGSWRIMEKCGMTFETITQHYNMDVKIYGISKDEFYEKNPA